MTRKAMRSMMSIGSACTRQSHDLKSNSARGRRSPRRPSSTASASAYGETIPGRVLAGGSEPFRSHRRVVDRRLTGCPAPLLARATHRAPSSPTLAALRATLRTNRRPARPGVSRAGDGGERCFRSLAITSTTGPTTTQKSFACTRSGTRLAAIGPQAPK